MNKPDTTVRDMLIAIISALLVAWIIIIMLEKRTVEDVPKKSEREKGAVRFYDESPLGRDRSGGFSY